GGRLGGARRYRRGEARPGCGGHQHHADEGAGPRPCADRPGPRPHPVRGRQARLAGQHPVLGQRGCGHGVDRPSSRYALHHRPSRYPAAPHTTAPPQPWAELPKVLDLAKRKNAVIKVSGACTLSREPYPFPDIWNPLARVFDAWGFERCLWGTDWTRAYAVVNYEQAVEPFLKTDRLSDTERAMLMGGACAKAYRWSPKKG